MAELTNKFNKEADDLKKLYSKYGKTDEFNQLDGAQKLVNLSVSNAGNTYKNLVELDRQSKMTMEQRGGLKNKKHLSIKSILNGKTTPITPSQRKNGKQQANKKEKGVGGRRSVHQSSR